MVNIILSVKYIMTDEQKEGKNELKRIGKLFLFIGGCIIVAAILV